MDLIAVEAVRVFHPEVFDELQRARSALTETTRLSGGPEQSAHKSAIERLMGAADEAGVREQMTALLRRVFPAGLRYVENNNYGSEWVAAWKRAHRLAHLDFLNLYLERTAPSGLTAFRHAETAVSLMPDGAAFGSYLDSLDPADLEDVVSNLQAYEETYPREAVVPASIQLLNRIAAIPERAQRGMLDFNRPDLVMERVVLRLLRRIESRERP
ncbi:hypothetical protein ACRAWB_17050 [Leifsonia poae]|uniref:hypothetical protein n=1 Tax=Leifsonia poae TaxID=110933 RepID=UPI003D6860EA